MHEEKTIVPTEHAEHLIVRNMSNHELLLFKQATEKELKVRMVKIKPCIATSTETTGSSLSLARKFREVNKSILKYLYKNKYRFIKVKTILKNFSEEKYETLKPLLTTDVLDENNGKIKLTDFGKYYIEQRM